MIQRKLGFGLSIALAVTCLASSSSVWSAEKAVSKSLKVARPQTPRKVAPSKTTSDVTPASCSSVADIQDSTIDECEALQERARLRRSRLYRESLIARHHRQKWEAARLEHENCKDWFNYIRGYGPAVWTRHGPELKWHPPSIPFAKRVNGTTVPHWEGVTDIPKPPEISPLRMYEIRGEEVKYRTQE